MSRSFVTTRRRALLALTGLIGVASGARASEKPAATSYSDAELLRLSKEFERVAERIDFAIDNTGPGQSYYDQMLSDGLDEYKTIHEQINRLQATTFQGLRVKARIAVWASAGRMYPEDTAILIDPIALSLAEDVLNIQLRYIVASQDV